MGAAKFEANALPVLIGSLPIKDHKAATQLVLEATPDIPLWVQLPSHPQEGMVAQFIPGMPGLSYREDAPFVDTAGHDFDRDLIAFFEDYLAVTEGRIDLNNSRFCFTPEIARGFFVFMDRIRTLSPRPMAVKGQVTGPITFCTGLPDTERRAIFYNEQVRDAGVKLLAMKAAWQTRQLRSLDVPVIVFIDEPALAGYGSSEQISISREEISICLEEVISAVHDAGGLAGIHVCANTDWSLILDSSVDIINFDAYAYFDRLILYGESLKRFIDSGRYVTWGIVPTLNTDDIDRESAESLIHRWEEQAAQVEALGIDRKRLLSQSLISPSCGTGPLPFEYARRVLELNRSVSAGIRAAAGLT